MAAGQYQSAIRDAGQAAYELHEESSVNEVLWLALMDINDFRGAAIEAHAVAHFGVTPTWKDVAMRHEDPNAFAEHLKKLETFVKRNQDSDFASFLLGYNNLVLGHKDAARQWLEVAVKLAPQDVICVKLLASLAPDPQDVPKPQPGLLPGDLQ